MKKINFLLLFIIIIPSILFFQQTARADYCHYVNNSNASQPINDPSACSTIESVATIDKCGINLSQQQSNPGTCCCLTNANTPGNSTDSSGYTPPPSSSEINMEQSINFQPQITLPIKPFNQTSIPVGKYNPTTGMMNSNLLAKYIKALYNYGLMIGGILAAVVLMGGGVLWLISAGNDSKIMQAKELITGSIVGLIILFGSWVILDTINPNLTVLPSINTQVISTDNIGCCEYTYNNTKQSAMMGSIACQTNKGKFFDNSNVNSTVGQYYVADPETNSCTTQGCCIIKDSNGNIQTCSASIATNCTKVPNSSFQPTSCSSVPSELDASGSSHSCGGNAQDQCANASDGSYCFPYTHHSNDANGAWCYSKTCWYGLGKKGEPCGNNQGSICLPSGNSGSYDFSLDSRNCDTGLRCYKK